MEAPRRSIARLAGTLVLACAAWFAQADQNAPSLDGLFERLTVAGSAEEASRIEAEIWQAWYEPPGEEAGRYVLQIESAMRLRQLDQALSASDTLVERFPSFAEGWNRRATVRYLLDDLDGSVADIERTLALEPRHFGAISGLGLIFLKQDDLSGALEAFEAVLELSPASRSAREGAERVRARMNDRDI